MGRRHGKETKRFSRFIRLLSRLRPLELPVTHRHNSVELYDSGRQFFTALFAAIRTAETSLLLEYYLIHHDHTGIEFANELAAAVGRGVRVKLIYDYIGCLDTPTSYFKNLAWQGIELLPFNPPSFSRGLYLFDMRDHRKMAIIDGSVAFLGGFNIGDEYAGRSSARYNFRDFGLAIRGDAVGELAAIFKGTWAGDFTAHPGQIRKERATDPWVGDAAVNIISGGPRQRRSFIRESFLVNIAAAAEEIVIATPYFVPGPRIIRALFRAVRRGVRVQLLLPARSDVPFMLLLGRSSYATLLKGGVEIFELEREILHAKVMLIDGERAIIGSANLDQRSFHRNFEINCLVDNSDFGAQIRDLLREEIGMARMVPLHIHERRGLLVRIMERIVSLFGWFL